MSEDVPIGRLLSLIIRVLAFALMASLVGLVTLGAIGGDPAASQTLTHVIETIIGVFIGIAAAKLADS